ncbi:hypothetical protein VC83_07097 [Pseudogymnoascus destructans]|uniref:Uncharacterized protein n=2 Tax=Pseudogymnoascus destructans TaxID=655981 RepID=L8FYB8_PSED2|nr:uncharacterized protein VC83_07097 [Pseudogymnoascus destructans]ELR04671.1 hypothetical protein GMDG_01529 [Pseudogymnoascus destructans 20631-21]OAF56891.1 hypothetical protein VC83_07097 [Pseudogymnoascus destructans]
MRYLYARILDINSVISCIFLSQQPRKYSTSIHSANLPEYITKHHAWGFDQPKAGFMISPFQTQFQIWFAKALGAKRILEIGCYISEKPRDFPKHSVQMVTSQLSSSTRNTPKCHP